MDQKKRRGVGIIRTAGNYEIEESFKERIRKWGWIKFLLFQVLGGADFNHA